jgi:hypothetical protein
MPFRQYAQFDTDMLKVMTEAHHTVAARLELIPADPRTGKLASFSLISRTRGCAIQRSWPFWRGWE